jgi:hypothetical protein
MHRLTLVSVSLLFMQSTAFAGNAVGNGNRMILTTYWGDDKVALIDLNGDPGHEEVWALDTEGSRMCKTI